MGSCGYKGLGISGWRFRRAMGVSPSVSLRQRQEKDALAQRQPGEERIPPAQPPLLFGPAAEGLDPQPQKGNFQRASRPETPNYTV